jgi:hypothetical protein
MQAIARSCSCVAIVLMGLAAPGMAHERAVGPTVAVPKTNLIPAVSTIPSVAARAVVPSITPVVSHSTSVIPATNAAVVVPAIHTMNPGIATATSRVDVMPRTVVISEPGAVSKLDLRSTHEATKALTTKGQIAAKRDAAVADAGGDTRFAATSTGTVTDAVAAAEPAPSQSRPMVLPSCR